MTDATTAASPFAGLPLYEQIGARYIDETWHDVIAHARHLASLRDPSAPPTESTIRETIKEEVMLLWFATRTEPRMSERVAAAIPYIERRLAGSSLPPVSLIDILTTLDRIKLGLVLAIDVLRGQIRFH
jgi:hypothetical protein